VPRRTASAGAATLVQPGIAVVHPVDDTQHEQCAARRDQVRSLASTAVSWVMVKTKTRSKKSSNVETRTLDSRRSRKVKAYSLAPCSTKCSRRSAASPMVGVCPSGTCHRTKYSGRPSWSNHSRLRRMYSGACVR
jgi:hypothetical protein